MLFFYITDLRHTFTLQVQCFDVFLIIILICINILNTNIIHDNVSRCGSRCGRTCRRSTTGSTKVTSKRKIVLTDENRIKGRKRIRLTTINSRRKKTRDCYKSYQNSIHEWYAINRPEICNERGELIFEKIAENCLTKAGLEEEAKQFKDFLNVRTHIRNYVDAEKKIPAKEGVGTLLGFPRHMQDGVHPSWKTRSIRR